MGDSLADRLFPEQWGANDEVASHTYTEFFDEYLPFYLSIGMTYEQYWDGEINLTRVYQKAYELQRKRDNEKLWLQGLYIYSALLDIAPSIRPMSKEQPKEYMSEPLPLTQKEADEREEQKEKERQQRIRQKFEMFAVDNNRRIQEAKDNG